jgi:tetratricopeptide (TPR) repeat protein
VTSIRTLPIIADAPAPVDKLEARTLAAARRLLDGGDVQRAAGALAPLAHDPTTPVRAHAGLLYAGVLLMSGRALDAVDVLERIPTTAAFPLDEGYRWMLMACALRSARRYDDGLTAALRSVEQGTTAGRLLVLADAYKHAGRLAEAIATLLHLLEHDPHHATGLAQLAGYRNLAGAMDVGARTFDKFMAVADGGASAKRNEAFYFATKGDVARTVAALAHALALEPAATRGYIADEVELDRFRGHEGLRALLQT